MLLIFFIRAFEPFCWMLTVWHLLTRAAQLPIVAKKNVLLSIVSVATSVFQLASTAPLTQKLWIFGMKLTI